MTADEVFGHWSEVREGLFQALDKLNDAQLDFVPREGLWSLGKAARHIANAEEGWFRYIVTHELSEWLPRTTLPSNALRLCCQRFTPAPRLSSKLWTLPPWIKCSRCPGMENSRCVGSSGTFWSTKSITGARSF